jgi:hypothetical protein
VFLLLVTSSFFLGAIHKIHNYTPASRRGRGYTVLPLSVCPFVHPRYFSSHFSQQLLMAEIWYVVTSLNYKWKLINILLFIQIFNTMVVSQGIPSFAHDYPQTGYSYMLSISYLFINNRDLGNNGIPVIEDNTFSNLPNLQILWVALSMICVKV